MRSLAAISISALLIAVAPSQPVAASGPQSSSPPPTISSASPTAPYARAVSADDGSVTLELCTRRFDPADGKGPTVHLVSAMHIADRAFYEAMQERLDRCDVVLFEGVKPAGAGAFAADLDEVGKINATTRRMEFLQLVVGATRDKLGHHPKDLDELANSGSHRYRAIIESSLTDAWGRRFTYEIVTAPVIEGGATQPGMFARLVSHGNDPASAADDIVVDGTPVQPTKSASSGGANIQAQLAKMLGVSFQLDLMDSGKPNWRNSDMSVDEVRERLEKAGPGAAAILSLLDGSSLQAKLASFFLGIMSQSKSLSGIVKMAMVDLLAANTDGLSAGIPGGEAAQRVIIDDRNAVVLADLKAIIAQEPAVQSVAIFYGAGHMPAFETSLTKDLGYRPAGDEWTAAMRADPKDAGMSAKEAARMRASFRGMFAPKKQPAR